MMKANAGWKQDVHFVAGSLMDGRLVRVSSVKFACGYTPSSRRILSLLLLEQNVSDPRLPDACLRRGTASTHCAACSLSGPWRDVPVW